MNMRTLPGVPLNPGPYPGSLCDTPSAYPFGAPGTAPVVNPTLIKEVAEALAIPLGATSLVVPPLGMMRGDYVALASLKTPGQVAVIKLDAFNGLALLFENAAAAGDYVMFLLNWVGPGGYVAQVAGGATSITLPLAKVDRLPLVTPSWLTHVWFSSYTTFGSIAINFGTAAPSGGGKLYVSMISTALGPGRATGSTRNWKGCGTRWSRWDGPPGFTSADAAANPPCPPPTRPAFCSHSCAPRSSIRWIRCFYWVR